MRKIFRETQDSARSSGDHTLYFLAIAHMLGVSRARTILCFDPSLAAGEKQKHTERLSGDAEQGLKRVFITRSSLAGEKVTLEWVW